MEDMMKTELTGLFCHKLRKKGKRKWEMGTREA